MSSVKPLPKSIHSVMRSGVLFYDLTSVVEGLIFNSLDSGAKTVSIFIGIGTFSIKVVDDRSGISRDDLALLGERYDIRNFTLINGWPTVVTLLAVPCILGVDLTDGDLSEFLQQLAETDGSSIMPPSVLRVLNFKACRGAIMFGDSLLPSECSLLVEELKKTKLCFQCAHGRPTTIPLVNLDELHKQVREFSIMDDRPNHPWHGLRRHEINLKRTTDRLLAALR